VSSDNAKQAYRPALYAVLWVAVGIFIIGLVIALIEIYVLIGEVRATQKSNTTKAAVTNKLVKRVDDCVNVNGKCYKDSRKQTAKFLGNVNEVAVLANSYAEYCAFKEKTPEAIGSCVQDLLTKAGYPPPVTSKRK